MNFYTKQFKDLRTIDQLLVNINTAITYHLIFKNSEFLFSKHGKTSMKGFICH
jgi:hypothetical protein